MALCIPEALVPWHRGRQDRQQGKCGKDPVVLGEGACSPRAQKGRHPVAGACGAGPWFLDTVPP